MHSALQQFRLNLLRARELGTLASAVMQMTTAVIDVSDIWRSQIVLGVSALDHLIHELARIGVVEISKGIRPRTDAFSRLQLPLNAFERALDGQCQESWLSDAIREKHSWLSFQHPDKIADAIRLISPRKLWIEVGRELNLDAKDVKLRVEMIVERRNKIAHEADMDPTNPGFRWPINQQMASDALDEIERVAEAVFKVSV